MLGSIEAVNAHFELLLGEGPERGQARMTVEHARHRAVSLGPIELFVDNQVLNP